MKAIIVLGFSLFALGTFAQTTEAKPKETKKDAPAQEKKPITFKTMTIERMEIPYDSKEPFVFEFKNTGKEPIIISDVRTSCGCTAAKKPTEPVAKGKTEEIVVTYDTKRIGDFTKTITVTSNVQTEPIILTIKGKVLPAPTTTAPAEDHSGHNH